MKIKKRPLVIVCPGGGYRYTSDREAEPLALSFLAKGFHVAVLRYSCFPAHYPTALIELARSVLIVRKHADEWYIDSDAIIIQGSSAGGHLAASFACFWHDDFLTEKLMINNTASCKEMLRPNGLILSYPVITSGEYAHKDSFVNLLGDELNELKEKMSLENAVNDNVPATFIWATYTDESVPVENSLLFALALKKQNINTELHVFCEGGHGLSLANHLTEGPSEKENVPSCEVWIDLACTWLKNKYCNW
ncbi:alpha/beta hydrolase [Butyrivibrio sp. YAB3001]|uniref:alpha/beta hydrolase n=1 Tax=Butyrivibrio sp. YAB3001 TaxID=1520812 RepID=UPI001FA860A1|nr:alpha/beta hydrolase [Butyrivibrio sp. YAB3001]